MSVDYRVGDVRAVMSTIADGSVSLVASSTPFIALRSYLPDDHPDKALEIGSEPDPATFLDTLLALTAEWGRVLAPWGSIAIELGDTFAGSGGAGGDYNEGGLRDGQNAFVGSSSFDRRIDTKRPKVSDGTGSAIRDLHGKVQGGGKGWPRAKSLALIPQLYATSLAYGRNLLTGQPSPAGQWLVRNVIVWHRPNPAVGALGDKVRPSTSYITVATRSPKRWFDLDAVRTTAKPHSVKYGDAESRARHGHAGYVVPERGDNGRMTYGLNEAGSPPLDCWFDHHDTWTLTTQPSSLAHYAMWPAKLAERLILMMCPAEVCAVCGEGRRRVTERTPEYLAARRDVIDNARPKQGSYEANVGSRANGFGTGAGGASLISHGKVNANPVTLGWSDCGHGNYVPGVVLDPFAGTGTTLAVADLHHRDAIGIDLDERNRDLYPRRRDECARALFDVRPQMTGQLDMFGEATP